MNLKLFNKWDTTGFEVEDIALKPYINIEPILSPRTGGRSAINRLWAHKPPIVERLINKLMVTGHRGKKHRYSSGHNTGKAAGLYTAVEKAFTIIEKQLNKNPVEVFVKAVENAAPREEITTIEYGGARYPQAVEVSPQRRIDIALRQITCGAYQKSFNTKVKIEKALADELIKAYNMDQGSQAISKKLELERQADASR
ncbi:MAG TPA: 30S ribosomal protein S7 [Candidatus Nanoarchaeia archaeon]|nr:30S ribosomal protein S7 [Candidatus Nanoarchaeia archaeon]